MTHLCLQVINLDSSNNTTEMKAFCFVPTRCGNLVPLKHVYTSWRKNGVSSRLFPEDHRATGSSFPVFKRSLSSTTEEAFLALSDPVQILLLHTLFSALLPEIPNEPPFKIQFAAAEGVTNDPDHTQWTDILFTDQIKLASIMFYMKHNQHDANSKMIEHCIVQQNQLLVAISLEQGTYAFEIKETGHEPMKPVLSRMIVLDGSFEF